MENKDEEKKPFDGQRFDLSEVYKNGNPHKHILTEFEEVNHTAARKKGLTAQQVATIVCRENPALLEIAEVKELIRAWQTDRQDLKEYRLQERMMTKTNKII